MVKRKNGENADFRRSFAGEKQVQLARYLIGKIPSVAQFWKLDGKMVKEIVEEEYKAAYHCSPCDKDLRKRGKCKEGKMNFQYPL